MWWDSSVVAGLVYGGLRSIVRAMVGGTIVVVTCIMQVSNITGSCVHEPPVNFLGLNGGTETTPADVKVGCVDGGRVVSGALGYLTFMRVQVYCNVWTSFWCRLA